MSEGDSAKEYLIEALKPGMKKPHWLFLPIMKDGMEAVIPLV